MAGWLIYLVDIDVTALGYNISIRSEAMRSGHRFDTDCASKEERVESISIQHGDNKQFYLHSFGMIVVDCGTTDSFLLWERE